ncbi:MAG: tyrosine--tRNA ligase [Candidatus Nanoarchaeia archaeon]|nr:tyrosine--tRNA ligase [Candidatus Haiyanarchaeum thermophilum]MCW1303091.1 tyrosine--tRNA ligase [Candidatus Haiyanarchaeum thermophilum]MCW1303756.1 tyrosine--tRNA ligase [Candidatus Haiyanarchaeum thermophilum]MCW1306629.1 tyrosine--tRNA ligase [Candidatus Haiyanarchaeum thermophilum]MCW1307041.1 tyrosine--tRNA ligase [Candidatus Haiyanarchaeum thermophilum]
MDRHEMLELIKKPPTVEILTEEKLLEYLEKKERLRHYIGFEISGEVHIGLGLVALRKVADFQEAGIETAIFLADYHSWINKKLNGNLDVIKKVAGGYFQEALKISLKCIGGDPSKTKFILGSEFYGKLGLKYLENVIKVSEKISLGRAMRSITIMGRKMGEKLDFAQLIYVPMQVADIFSLGVNLAHGGLDQRKAHVIAIEVWKEFGYKPVAVHHHLLMGIHVSEEQRRKILEARKRGDRKTFEESIIDIKMSKSRPQSAIFIHDSEEEIRKKIRSAFCPPNEIELNPIVEIAQHIIFPWLSRREEEFQVKNLKKGGVKKFKVFGDLEKEYMEGKIHPMDLKDTVANYLIQILEPARKYFLEGNGKKYLEEMRELEVTR